MFPTGTPEQYLLETLLEIERKPPDRRTLRGIRTDGNLKTWYVDTARVWDCRCYQDVWRFLRLDIALALKIGASKPTRIGVNVRYEGAPVRERESLGS